MKGLLVRHIRGASIATMIAIYAGLIGPSSARAEHRTALLIGNAAYPGNAALASPEHDIKAVSTVLEKHGFHTKLVSNLDQDGLNDVVSQFITNAPINGTSLVYFSGYVVTEKSQDQSDNPILLGIEGNRNGMPLKVLVDWINQQSATAQNVFVLDGCYRHPGHSPNAGPSGISAIPLAQSGIWLGYADGANKTREPVRNGLSTLASTIATSNETDLGKLLTDACGWTRTTCRHQPFTDPPTVAVSSPDRFPESAHPGDEWVAPDGNVFCWCRLGTDGGFWIGKYEVVQCKWPIPDTYGAFGPHRNYPTIQLRTKDIVARLAARTRDERKAGRLPEDWEYALPSPEQWEHAARAGSSGDRYFEDSEIARHANFADKSLFDTQNDSYLYADSSANDGTARLAPVGRYRPNAWGLHDVYGNVWEQTETGVLCGGSWVSLPDYCRATIRKPPLKSPTDFAGIRLVVRPVALVGRKKADAKRPT